MIRLRSDLVVVDLSKLTCRVLLIGSRTAMLVPARSTAVVWTCSPEPPMCASWR
ncbi:hypothetical protein [Nocardia africana]|uniref:hypothetical protein n=1 Tax=Nocardia africana TaxID=134964 RepID=UPI001D13A302|nr:hypothetical protein [Nocardia africana]MCC3316667.1 hypothetical protein [Nocardia africana]